MTESTRTTKLQSQSQPQPSAHKCKSWTFTSFKMNAILSIILCISLALTLIGLTQKRFLQSALLQTENNNGTYVTPHEFLNSSDTRLSSKQFQKYQHDFPCIRKSTKTRNVGDGFCYIKVHKTASSTIAVITKSIIDNQCGKGYTYYNSHTPLIDHTNLYRSRHSGTNTTIKPSNNQKNSFLFTFVREPTKRAISDFLWRSRTQRGLDVNLDHFYEFCCRQHKGLNGLSGYQLGFISPDERLPEYTFWNGDSTPTTDTISTTNTTNTATTWKRERIHHPKLLVDTIAHVFDAYDFVGVTERIDESLVVLAFLLNLQLTDVTYVSEKHGSHGDYIFVRNHDQGCVKVEKPELTDDIQEYIQSNEWKARTAGDLLLHRTAIQALDNTIDNVMGRDLFEKKLKRFHMLQERMGRCATACSRCSSTGQTVGNQKCDSCVKRVHDEWRNLKNKS